MIRYTTIIKTKHNVVCQWIWAYTAYQAKLHAQALARFMSGRVISVMED